VIREEEAKKSKLKREAEEKGKQGEARGREGKQVGAD